ncbi:MAG TPA: universal stress protein [Solirubrobacterales bacterium]
MSGAYDFGIVPASDIERPVLIAYDGSDFAKAAIAAAANQLGPARKAVVVTVWEPLDLKWAANLGNPALHAEAYKTVGNEARVAAERLAETGAELASEAGFDVRSELVDGSPAWQRIVEAAEKLDAGLIVLGSCGRTGLSYVLLGSVATAVARHSKRPVFIAHDKS